MAKYRPISIGFVLLVILFIFTGNGAFAAANDDIATNDTCASASSNVPTLAQKQTALIANRETQALTAGHDQLLEVYHAATKIITDFSIDSANCAPAETITFRYGTTDTTVTLAQAIGGWKGSINGGLFQVIKPNDSELCVQYHTGTTQGWLTMGCRSLPPVASTASIAKACYVGASCYYDTTSASKNLIPMSSVIVQCFQETLSKIFMDARACPGRVNLFVTLKDSLRKAITAALTLYVIFFGIKVVLGQEVPEKGEVFMFIIKMILVMYFSIGDGIVNDLYPALMGAAQSFAQIIFESSGAAGLCDYTPTGLATSGMTPYPAGHEDMALWDALDCRILYYMGIYNTAVIDLITRAGSDIAALGILAVLCPPIFAVLLPLLLGLQLLPFIMMIIFAILLLSVAVYVVHTYLIAIVTITLIVFLAPLFIPMALFKVTKTYYDNWLRVLLSFTLQPMVLFSFLGLMMSVMDKIYYGTCTFRAIGTTQWPLFTLNPSTDSGCTSSFGYKMDVIANALSGGAGETIDAMLFSFEILLPIGTGGDMYAGLFQLCLFLFIFYHLTVILSNIAQDLTGGIALGHLATKATAIADKAAEKARNYAKNKIGSAGNSDKGDEKGNQKDDKKGDKKDDETAPKAQRNDGGKGGGASGGASSGSAASSAASAPKPS